MLQMPASARKVYFACLKNGNRFLLRPQNCLTGGTIDQQRLAILHTLHKLRAANDCRNPHRTCQNCTVRGPAAVGTKNSGNMRKIHADGIRWSELLRNQNHIGLKAADIRLWAVQQYTQQLLTQIAKVARTLLHIRVRRTAHQFLQRAKLFIYRLCGGTCLTCDLLANRRDHRIFILENLNMRFEYFRRLFVGCQRSFFAITK